MGDAAILLEALSVRFRAGSRVITALDAVDVRVEAGRVFGFLGPNGAGKTTAIHVLLGFLDATSGRASLFGHDVRQRIARRRLGYLAEQPDAYRFLTGREMLRFAGRLCGLRGRDLEQRIVRVMEEVDLSDAADRRLGTYSRGMRQRLGLAQAIVHDPDLLILDEPTGGLDPIARLHVRGLIDRWHRNGKTVFFSSHELSEVELVCDEICILSAGRVVASGAPTQLVPPGERLEPYFMRVVSRDAPPSPSPP